MTFTIYRIEDFSNWNLILQGDSCVSLSISLQSLDFPIYVVKRISPRLYIYIYQQFQ